MKYFSDYYANLSPYKEFNPKAFIGDDNISQELCNFILALSLAYNDYKYYRISYDMLLKSKPEDPICKNPVRGELAGIQAHLTRLLLSFTHQLLELIENNQSVLQSPFFQETIRILSKEARQSWKIIVEAALHTNRVKESNLLARIRNKVAFHYDAEELFVGYKKGFITKDKTLQDPCVSLGKDFQVRFYFADRAVQAYLEKILENNAADFIHELTKITQGINIALYEICIKFIQRRGFAWKNPV